MSASMLHFIYCHIYLHFVILDVKYPESCVKRSYNYVNWISLTEKPPLIALHR